jgi:hypothetical protein
MDRGFDMPYAGVSIYHGWRGQNTMDKGFGISKSILMVYLTSIHDILNHLPIVYRTLYIWYFKPPCSWYIEPQSMVYRTPYPWYIEPPAYGISNPCPGISNPLSME